jgi:hypothetical protein
MPANSLFLFKNKKKNDLMTRLPCLFVSSSECAANLAQVLYRFALCDRPL